MLKNFEKLNGFKIIPTTLIEVIYDLNFNIVGYFLLVYRENYPFPMYIKLNSTLDTVLECYPYILQENKKYSLKVVKKNIPFQTRDLFAQVYFSWNLENDDVSEEYRGIGISHTSKTLVCYKNKNIKTVYNEFTKKDIDQLEYLPEIKEFFEKSNANYIMVYFDNVDKLKPKKFFLGYSGINENRNKIAERINLKKLIEENNSIK